MTLEISATTLAVRRRNFICFTLDAALFFVAMSFVDMSSVIPSLVGHLTQSPVLIGVLGSVQTGCWLLPQIFAARIVPGKRRKLPMVLIATTISRLGWAILLVALIFYQQIGPLVTVAACYLAVGTFTMFDGISALAWYDLIARAIPPTIRGRLFGAMSLIGGVLGIGGGLIVERIVGNPLLPFPSDYRTLVAVTLLILAVGITPLALVVEPEGEEAHPLEPLGAYLRRLPGLLRDRPSFRRLVGVQLLVGTSGLAVPFYAPFAVIGLGVPESVVGTFVIGVTAGLMVGGAAWGYLGDHGHKHRAIRAIAACGFLAPIIPLVLEAFGGMLPPLALSAALTLSFFLIGCCIRSGWVAYSNYVIELADPDERPMLLGLMNTLSGSLAIMPPLGGLLAAWLGYEAAFVAAALPAALGLAFSFRLHAPEALRIALPQA